MKGPGQSVSFRKFCFIPFATTIVHARSLLVTALFGELLSLGTSSFYRNWSTIQYWQNSLKSTQPVDSGFRTSSANNDRKHEKYISRFYILPQSTLVNFVASFNEMPRRANNVHSRNWSTMFALIQGTLATRRSYRF
ncbi:hypothetical protein F5878DRAFT_620004 [Lentinula raphanica]|uniref:Uncharacterized protein n=1 Tax=Lentinula raphanica TaxID=153919 RepID=A0AA38P8H8_9AGAR|nr:hypothetical protein F5880DRAFT_868531 [Lentinula raphanica]KAJ3838269.1 hypothetical protein F5878DRAFT_620004 [Lentinula raphanica]